MKLNKTTKHEHCLVGVLQRHTGPHTGELVCVDPNCTHSSKHIKWIAKNNIECYESATSKTSVVLSILAGVLLGLNI